MQGIMNNYQTTRLINTRFIASLKMLYNNYVKFENNMQITDVHTIYVL